MRILWSPFTIDRVDEIVEHIAIDSLVAAEKWMDTIFKKVLGLKGLTKKRAHCSKNCQQKYKRIDLHQPQNNLPRGGKADFCNYGLSWETSFAYRGNLGIATG